MAQKSGDATKSLFSENIRLILEKCAQEIVIPLRRLNYYVKYSEFSIIRQCRLVYNLFENQIVLYV